MTKQLDEAQRKALLLEVLAFLTDTIKEIWTTPEQLAYICKLATESGLDGPLAVHFMMHPTIKVLFERIREAVLAQTPQAPADLEEVAHFWGCQIQGGVDVLVTPPSIPKDQLN